MTALLSNILEDIKGKLAEAKEVYEDVTLTNNVRYRTSNVLPKEEYHNKKDKPKSLVAGGYTLFKSDTAAFWELKAEIKREQETVFYGLFFPTRIAFDYTSYLLNVTGWQNTFKIKYTPFLLDGNVYTKFPNVKFFNTAYLSKTFSDIVSLILEYSSGNPLSHFCIK